MRPDYNVNPQATESAFGGLATDRVGYHPLDTVTVSIKGRASGDTHCTIRVCDPEQRPYFEADVLLKDGHGEVRFQAGGPLGTHY